MYALTHINLTFISSQNIVENEKCFATVYSQNHVTETRNLIVRVLMSSNYNDSSNSREEILSNKEKLISMCEDDHKYDTYSSASCAQGVL